MAESRHTPGPWTVVRGSQGYIDADIGGDGMLSIEGGTAGSADWGENEHLTLAVVLADVEPIASEAEANARLMNAAPDLLAALRLAMPHLEQSVEAHDAGMRVTDPEDPEDPADLIALRAAVAAIAKAEEATNG